MGIWTVGNIVSVAINLIALFVGGGGILIYFGYHKRKHENLDESDQKMSEDLRALTNIHNQTMQTCPITVISAEHKDVMVAVRESRESIGLSKQELAKGSERFTKIEQHVTATHTEIKDLQIKVDNMVNTKLDDVATKVNTMFGYLQAQSGGKLGEGKI